MAGIADTFEPADGAQPVAANFGTPAGPVDGGKDHGALHDFANQAWASAQEMGEGLIGAYEGATRALGASPEFVQHVEAAKRIVAAHVASTLDDMSPQAKEAYHASIFGDGSPDAPTPGQVGWGHYIGATIASQIPGLLLAVVPGGIAGRVALKATGSLAAATAASTATTGAAFGAQQAGDAYNSLVNEIDKAPMSEIMQSPVAQELKSQNPGISDTDIKKQVVGKLAPMMMAQQFGVGAVTGAGVGGMITHGALGAAGRGLLGRAAIGAGEGAATMAAQAGGQNAVQQQTQQQAGIQKEFDPTQLAHAVASGALGGAILGGAAGTVHAGSPAKPEGVPEETHEPGTQTTGVQSDVQQALQGALDLNHAPPGTNAGQPQGELFRTIDQANQGQGQPVADNNAPNVGTKTAAPAQAASQPQQPSLPGIAKTAPEPANDLAAQLKAVADPNNPKDAVFIPAGGAGLKKAVRDAIPPNAQVVSRPGVGRLVTTNPDKANTFKTQKTLTDDDMADLLGYTETKQAAVASGSPTVVQGKDNQGNVVQEQLASPQGVPAAQEAVAQVAPNVEQTTPEAAIAARAEPEQPPAQPEQPAAPTVVDKAAAKAEEPSPAQAEAGNYQKGHVNIGGLDISIETPKGGTRRGTGPDGTPWEATMPDHYGYIKRTEGADGDHVDVTLGPNAHEADQHPVYVFDQIDPKTKKFDEHKAFLGYGNPHEAIEAYDKSFSDGSGPSRRGAMNQVSFDEFKDWAQKGDTKSALSYKPPSKADALKSQAAAKRAAQKAKMNPQAVAEKPRAFVTEGEAPEVETNRTNAAQNMRDAAGKVEVIPLKKGDDVRPIVNRVMRELMDKVGSTDGSPDAVAETIDAWAKGKTGMIPGTKTAYRDFALSLMKQATGRDMIKPRPEGIRDAMRGDMAGQDKRTGAKIAGEAEDAEAKVFAQEGEEAKPEGETTTVGPTTTAYGEGGKARKEPVKITDKLPYWLDRVLQGEMTAAEVHEKYGIEGTGAGRSRKYPTFRDYVEAQLEKAEQAASVDRLVDNVGKTRQAKSQATKEEQLALKHIDQLHDVLDNLPERESKDEDEGPKILGRKAHESAPEEVGRRDIENLLDSGSRSVHDHLDAIINSKDMQKQAPHAVWLARILKGRLPKNLQVMSMQEAQRRFGQEGYNRAGYHGYYAEAGSGSHTGAFIAIHDNSPEKVNTLLHEGMHAVTSAYIDKLDRSHPDYQAISAIAQELQSGGQRLWGDLNGEERATLEYALSNPHELHTMLMTDPVVMKLASEMTPSQGFLDTMNKLGYTAWTKPTSVWSYFTNWVRKALGLTGPLSGERATLLDHVLKPLQDITDRAHVANLKDAPWQVGSAGSAARLGDIAMHGFKDFGGIKGDIERGLDVGGKFDGLRRARLAATTTDGIVSTYKNLFKAAAGNLLERYRDVTESVAARSTQFRNDHSDRVSSLIKATGKLGAERDKLAQLMNDATLAEAHLGKNADNSHLDDPTVANRLQARYDALSPDAQRLYDQFKKYYADTHEEERTAQLNGLVNMFLRGATDAQKDAFRTATKDRPTLEKFLESIKSDAGWDEIRPVVRGVGNVYKQGFVQGDYFPLRRFGDYVVRYGTREDGDYGVEMFEKRGDAEARRAELAKQGVLVKPVVTKNASSLRNVAPSTTVVDELMSAMHKRPELAEHADEARDLLSSIILQHATHSEAALNAMRRKGVIGASTDLHRVLARDFLSTSSRIGYLEHGPERFKALQDLRDHADTLTGAGDQIKAQAVIHELEQRMPTGDDASGALTGFARRMSTLGFVQSLMSPSHMLTSSLEAHMNSTAILGARHNPFRTSAALARAMKDIAPGMVTQGVGKTLKAVTTGLKSADWNLSTYVRDKLIRAGADKASMVDLFNRLNNAGLIDHSMVREMQRIANPGMDATKGWWGKFLDINAAGSHAVDVMNKTAIAKAAYDLELAKTGSHDAAAKYAVDTVRQAMPNYNVANKARVTTNRGFLGGFAAPLTQFKQYGFHQYSMMGALLKASLHGATSAERNEARMAFAGILATHTLMAGSLTLVADPLRWIGGAYDYITGAGAPHDYQNDARRWLAATFGPEVGELLARGLSHAIGIDAHQRVGLSNLLEFPELKSFDNKGFLEAIGAAMTGASGQDASTMAGGVEKMLQGDVWGGLKDFVPRVVRDAMKADALATQGVTDSRGKVILPASKISEGNVVAQALGFQPAKVSEFREGRFAVQEAQEEAKSLRAHLMQHWLSEPDDRTGTMQRIREFNQQHPGQHITVQQLLTAAKRARTDTANQASFGLRLPKKAAKSLEQAGSFANLQ